MQTKPKSNSVVTHRVAEDKSTITYIVAGAGEVTFHRDRASVATREWAEIHGWIQRHSDGAAKSRDPKTGKPADPSAKLAGIIKLVEHYETGTDEWKTRAERVTQDARDAGDVVLAMTRAKRADGTAFAKDVDAANAIVAAWAKAKGVDRDAAIKAWLKTAQISREVAEIRIERERAKAAETTVDADALMAEMDQ